MSAPELPPPDEADDEYVEPKVLNAPKRIWLNVGELEGEDVDFLDLHEVTWADQSMFRGDIAYVREDALAEQKAEQQAQPVAPEGWIPVASGKLPPLDEMCLVYVPCAMHFKYAFDSWQVLREAPVPFSSATIEVGEGWGDHNYEEVSHWMPLAAAPSAPTAGE